MLRFLNVATVEFLFFFCSSSFTSSFASLLFSSPLPASDAVGHAWTPNREFRILWNTWSARLGPKPRMATFSPSPDFRCYGDLRGTLGPERPATQCRKNRQKKCQNVRRTKCQEKKKIQKYFCTLCWIHLFRYRALKGVLDHLTGFFSMGPHEAFGIIRHLEWRIPMLAD